MDIYLQLQRALQRFQERNRFIADAYGTGLSLLESRLLTDISLHEKVTAADLSREFSLTRLAISRALAGMKEARLVRVVPDPNDGRRQFLHLTEHGANTLAAIDRSADERIDEFVARLSADEFRRVLRYWSVLADGLGVPPQPFERREHPLRRYVRRVTQGLGLLTTKVYGLDDLSSVEWHILLKLEAQSHSILAKTIVSAFGMPTNTVAGVIQRLLRRKLIIRAVDARDRRQLTLGLTTKGQKMVASVEEVAKQMLRAATQPLSVDEVRDFSTLLLTMIGERTPTLLSPDGEPLECVELRTPAERDSLRAFCAAQAVRRGKEGHISERFYASESRCFALRHGEQIFACVELQPSIDTRGAITLTHLASAPIIDDLAILDNFIALIVEALLCETPRRRIAVSRPWLRVGAQLPDGVVVE